MTEDDHIEGRGRLESSAAENRRTKRFLCLMPSKGKGGGIERYASAVLAGLRDAGYEIETVAVLTDDSVLSVGKKIAFTYWSVQAAARLRSGGIDFDVLAMHPSFALLAVFISWMGASHNPPFVFAYGAEVWKPAMGLRAATYLKLRLVTISDFTAGALVQLGTARILPPGLGPEWFDRLSAACNARPVSAQGPLKVLTVFRLDAADAKGLATLVQAVETINSETTRITLTIAGSGTLPDRVITDLQLSREFITIVPSPSDEDLVDLYRLTDLFVLCTRVRSSRRVKTGEGFGIVLLEAQLAGAAVVGPAAGGSSMAYVEGWSGLRPVGEGPAELVRLLDWCTNHRDQVRKMGQHGHDWAANAMNPERYRQRVAAVVRDG